MPGGKICARIVMFTGNVPLAKAYSGISWTSVVMIAAIIPMGLALQKTGLAQMAANALVDSLGAIHSNYFNSSGAAILALLILIL